MLRPLLRPLLVLLVLLAPLSAAAQQADLDARLEAWNQRLDELEGVVAAGDLDEETFALIRDELRSLIEEARAAAAAVDGTADVTQQMIDALGPPPAEGEAGEPEIIARERQRLSTSLAALRTKARQADLVATRADILLGQANDRRMAVFAEALFQRGPSPLEPATWAAVPTQVGYLHDLLLDAESAEPLAIGDDLRLLLVGAAVLAFAIGLPLRRWIHRRYGFRAGVTQPSYRQRVLATVAEAAVRGLMPAIAAVFAYFGLLALIGDTPFTGIIERVAGAACVGLVFFFFFSGLAHAICAPENAHWRIAEVDGAAAGPLTRRLFAMAATLGFVGSLLMILDRVPVPAELHAVVFFALTVLTALTLIALSLGRHWRRLQQPAAAGAAPGAPPGLPPGALPAAPPPGSLPLSDGAPPLEGEPALERRVWPKLRALAVLVSLSAVVASASGYHAFARYLGQVFFAGLAAAGFVLLLRGILREMLELFVVSRDGRVAALRRTLFPRARGLRFFQYLMLVLLDLFLLFLWVVLLLPVTGIAWGEMRSWLLAAADGISIGGFVLRPTDILLAVAAFAVVLTVTRFIQRQVNDRVLAKLQVDHGVQNSITIGVGYVGVIIAIVVGIATLGLDLSNLALIAGALSVGIGFGLQNVVQNFVAGLILLVERPIKVGDWVVVGQHQGTVKRISVRATEVQTFQRASVIIPNAELVSTAVVNWTHKDKVARIDIKIGVDYGTDLKRLRAVLLDCAGACENVLRYPAPIVAFLNFGDSSLDFELRVYIADTDHYLQVSNDLRFLIAERLEEAGIGIPFPQRVLHIPQMDRLSEALGGRKDRDGERPTGERPTADRPTADRPAVEGEEA